MKVKKYLVLVALSTLLLAETSSSTLVFAENFPDQQMITAENHQEISGRYTVDFVNDELLVTFLLAALGLQIPQPVLSITNIAANANPF